MLISSTAYAQLYRSFQIYLLAKSVSLHVFSARASFCEQARERRKHAERVWREGRGDWGRHVSQKRRYELCFIVNPLCF